MFKMNEHKNKHISIYYRDQFDLFTLLMFNL